MSMGIHYNELAKMDDKELSTYLAKERNLKNDRIVKISELKADIALVAQTKQRLEDELYTLQVKTGVTDTLDFIKGISNRQSMTDVELLREFVRVMGKLED